MSEPQSRQESEREFHDKLFGEGTQSRDEKVGKFYSVIEGSMDFYRDHINRNCKDNRVLDYGCGEGLWSFYMAERGAKVTAIDISEVAIEQARNRIDWRAMDAEDLDLPDDSFDMICGTSILHHLDLEKCYREIARVLSPDGNAVFLEPMGHNPLINLYSRDDREHQDQRRAPAAHAGSGAGREVLLLGGDEVLSPPEPGFLPITQLLVLQAPLKAPARDRGTVVQAGALPAEVFVDGGY